jgi:hypothetical protein
MNCRSLIDMLTKLVSKLNTNPDTIESRKPIEVILSNAKMILPCNEKLLTELESCPQDQIAYNAGKLFCQLVIATSVHRFFLIILGSFFQALYRICWAFWRS